MKTRLLKRIRKPQRLSPETYGKFAPEFRKDAIAMAWLASDKQLRKYRKFYKLLKKLP